MDDVAAGHGAALERGAIGARYALGGENASQMRVFDIVRQITGRRRPRRIPFRRRHGLGAAEELRVNLFGGTPLVTRGVVDIFRHDWSLDSSLAVRELGYSMTPLDEGVRADGRVDNLNCRPVRTGRPRAAIRSNVTAYSERARQWVHIGSGLFALLLRVLTW